MCVSVCERCVRDVLCVVMVAGIKIVMMVAGMVAGIKMNHSLLLQQLALPGLFLAIRHTLSLTTREREREREREIERKREKERCLAG